VVDAEAVADLAVAADVAATAGVVVEETADDDKEISRNVSRDAVTCVPTLFCKSLD